MKKLAVLLIVFGCGLAAFGIFGYQGSQSADDTGELPGRTHVCPDCHPAGWSQHDQYLIVLGVISLASGVLLRRDSK